MAEAQEPHPEGEDNLEWYLGESAISAYRRDGPRAQEYIERARAIDPHRTAQMLGECASFFDNIVGHIEEGIRRKTQPGNQER